MHPITMLLASFVLAVVAGHLQMHRRQDGEVTFTYLVASETPTSTVVTATISPNDDNVEKMCVPTFWKWTKYGTALKEVIEAKGACVCSSKAFALKEACSLCYAAQGGISDKTTQKEIRFERLVERRFCNAIVPEANIYWIDRELWEEEPAEFSATYSDKFSGKTEVSIYYSSDVRPQTTHTFVPGSEITETMDLETSSLEPFTRGSTFDVAPSVGLPGLPGATLAGAAGELKAGGGVVMAMLGAMVSCDNGTDTRLARRVERLVETKKAREDNLVL